MTGRYAPPASGAWREVTLAEVPDGWPVPPEALPLRVRLRVAPDAVGGALPDADVLDEGLPHGFADLVLRLLHAGVAAPCALEPHGQVLIEGCLEVGRLVLGTGGPEVPWTFGLIEVFLGFGGMDDALATADPGDDPGPLPGPPTDDLVAAEPPPPGDAPPPRLLQCRVGPARKGAEPDNTLRAGRNAVDVFLGPEEAHAILGGVVTDADLQLAAGEVVAVVDVQLTPLAPEVGEVSAGQLAVPRTGRTASLRLRWDVPRGATAARAQLLVSRDGRVVTLADLTGDVGGPVTFTRSLVADPPPTAPPVTSVVVDADAAGTPAVTVPAARRVALLPQLAVLAERLRDDLNRIVDVPVPATTAKAREAARVALVEAATDGRDLFDQVAPLLGDLAGARAVQVVTALAPFALPVELLYLRPAPLPDATVCPTWLAGGACGEACGGDAPERVVCPAGFWGVDRLVERLYKPDNQGDAELQVPTPDADQPRLTLGGLVVGASDRVTATALTQADLDPASRVTGWDAWRTAVAGGAGLLVLLPHTLPSPAQLEISGEFLRRPHLTAAHVTAGRPDAHPAVVLFGCDTAGQADDPIGFATAFLNLRAGVVFASLSLLRAGVAATLASRLVAALRDPARAGQSVAQVLTDVRRAAVRDGVLAGLALTSYGSSDWEV